MSAQAFQGAVAALVTDRRIREGVVDGERVADLTDEEQEQLRGLASDPGLRLTAEFVASFRLGKLLTLLPLTRAVLGDDAFAAEVCRFWDRCPPTSFYLPDEALAFTDHLGGRIADGDLDDPLLPRIIDLERAEIVARHPGRRDR